MRRGGRGAYKPARKNRVLNPLPLSGVHTTMANSRFKLTAAFIEEVSALVAEGASPEAAAQACGVPAGTFRQWLAIGQKAQRRCMPRALWDAVSQALARTRVEAEKELRATSPKTWLLSGPAKELGWSLPARPPAPPPA